MAFTTNSFKLAVSPLVFSLTTISPPPSWGFFNSTAFCCRSPAAAVSRRLFLPSVSGIWDALTGGGGNRAPDAVLAIRRGMLLFRQGDVHGSLAEFDKAIELDPRQKAYLWQRGLSLYYLNRFEEGAEQFRIDVEQNPNDTEESIWCFLCEAQLYGVDEARKRFLEVGRDPRPVMREAYNLFKDGGDPEKLVSGFLEGRENEYFYAYLYAGLYYESEKNQMKLSDVCYLHVNLLMEKGQMTIWSSCQLKFYPNQIMMLPATLMHT
ncbi:hypothetical protein MLD38_010536 [Melastoma candidum]|uniref:Uncharacterized protein n=1 Tax=Melastoma candidum TaxID=119954 RepID=A0ACB9R3P6_9MYRT|nr:hypothetical protein MLD38_010536 [Melastoma candidum]